MQSHRCLPRRRLIIIIFLGILLYEASIAAKVIHSTQLVPQPAQTDVAIVLGAAVWRDQPSPVFAARIDYALDLLANGTVQQIIFTGGVGSRDRLAESTAAARYAIARGGDVAALRCETTSATTWGNLIAASAIVQQEGWQTVTIVSDPLHIYRATLMAQDLKLNPRPGPTPYTRYQSWNSQFPFLLRELFFVHQYRLQRLFPFVGKTISPINSQCEL